MKSIFFNAKLAMIVAFAVAFKTSLHRISKPTRVSLGIAAGLVTFGLEAEGVITVKLTFFGEAVAAAIYDDFDDNSLDLFKWDISTEPDTVVEEIDGRLELSILPTASGEVFGTGVVTLLGITGGDFDVQVDFSLLSWPEQNGVRSALTVSNDTSTVHIERSATSPLGFFPERYVMNSPAGIRGEVLTSDQTGKLRMQRVGDVITGYYFDNVGFEGWIPVASYTNTEVGFGAGDFLTFNLNIWSHDDPAFFNPGGERVTVAFDNVSIVPEPVPVLEFDLSGDQVVPAISTAGNGTLELAPANDVINYTLTYQDLEGALLQAHIHFGQRSVTGGFTVWLCSNEGGLVVVPVCPESPGAVNGSFDASDIQAIVAQGLLAGDLNALIAAGNDGLLYADVHTESFPGGEIRGQLD